MRTSSFTWWRTLMLIAAAIGLGTSALACAQSDPSSANTTSSRSSERVAPSPSTDDESALVAHGHQLAVAADCAACHTSPEAGSQPFAGGYPIDSPLGEIFSTNITPSKQYGIGNYSEMDFARALRQGIRADGAYLYPAMPYPSYTQLSDEDIHALYIYFMQGVEPVNQPTLRTDLPFPFDIRSSMAIWNWLYLDDQRFQPDPQKSDEWNRGAYLVQALAHCSSCHTPRNFMMAEDQDRAFAGGSLSGWFAPNITPDKTSGIGSWSHDQITQYLGTGRLSGKAFAGGGMAEVIEHSLQYLPRQDLGAIATYLEALPVIHDDEQRSRFDFVKTGEPLESTLRGKDSRDGVDTLDTGAKLYSANCSSCHQANGEGSRDQLYPALFHNSVTGARSPDNLIMTIINGVQRDAGGEDVLMPAFGDDSYATALDDEQIAQVVNYVATEFGNPQMQTTAEHVAQVRAGGAKPALVKLQPYIVPAMVIGGIVVLAIMFALWLLWRRRRR